MSADPLLTFRLLVDVHTRETVAVGLGVSTYVVRDLYYGDVPFRADELQRLVELYPEFDLAGTVLELTALRRKRGLVKPRSRRK